MDFNLKKMYNEYVMLKCCINRMFITDDREELPRLYENAKHYVARIYGLAGQRLDEEGRGVDGCRTD